MNNNRKERRTLYGLKDLKEENKLIEYLKNNIINNMLSKNSNDNNNYGTIIKESGTFTLDQFWFSLDKYLEIENLSNIKEIYKFRNYEKENQLLDEIINVIENFLINNLSESIEKYLKNK